MRVLTGIQPSGTLHIGNYFGAMKPMIDMMNNTDNEIFCFIADYHALTSIRDPKQLRENITNTILDWVACGLDPDKITFYVQSDIPEVQELAWLLHTICPMGLLERGVAYRDKVENGVNAHSGLFNYPVLMAADILMVQADIVPVGKDQKQHIEIARDLAIKFNYEYGELFTLPEGKIEKSLATLPGIDGRKMSKSYKNTIPLFAEESVIKKQIMSIVTSSLGVDEKKDPDSCNVFALYKVFASEEEQATLAKKYTDGGMGYGEAKKILLEKVIKYFTPMWEKRKELIHQPDLIKNIRKSGVEKVRPFAQKVINQAKEKVGIL
ncbi:tryptophan--tRNA ligase [Candidatus Peregrinibacteria bacterium]|nr:MAG: tryptophan--tRNA ligase [Candidatus Peregrinibacteria bacterium]